VIVQTINLTKRYGKLVALNNLDLNIEEGECFGYIGPNGAGKTTTIKILATLLQPTWGEARICGHVVGYESRKIRPLIGYVPDFFGAYEEVVVQEYLEFFASAYGITGKQRTRVVNDVLELTDLVFKRDAMVDSLSRGMQQRLSVARAILKNAPILILDEPTSSLDAISEEIVFAALKRLRAGRTTIVIAHRLSTVRDADRILVLDGGRIAAQGRHEELLQTSLLYRRMCARLSVGKSLDDAESVDDLIQAAQR